MVRTLENTARNPRSRGWGRVNQQQGVRNVAGTEPVAEGITNPPIDDLLGAVDSKYSLVTMAAKRARQINAYYAQLGEGLLEYVGPLVETQVQEKALSIALREVNDGLLSAEPHDQGGEVR
ncbi:hypothetical protein GCM10022402_16110 [Salinactinospora qingdaonensis]|uniref:DNA-directed RNA polymerase subunit omega n=1 Tax=Salinactinospora qingdaonensis TaxID=702744 RepID=A0ABP7FG31_9ACTN